MKKLVINGGAKTLESASERFFHWPIVTQEDIAAVTEVLCQGSMSGTEITKQFEKEYADWNGSQYALGCCNGTAGLAAALWSCNVGAGDEVIAPALTYWASCAAVLTLGGTVNFAEVDPETLCISPSDVAKRITPRTRAIVVVNYAAMPADWDTLLPLARQHNIKIIEDNSHAHGSLYKGKMCGSFGDIAVASLMAGKSLAIGEAGMITTNDRTLYERCIAFGHYERTGVASRFNPADAQIHDLELQKFAGLPLGAVKHRMNQTCSAMGRVQLKYYPERCAVIQKAMNYLADGLDQLPGLKVFRPTTVNSTKGGWYYPLCSYNSHELAGVSAESFAAALSAEGIPTINGANRPLHTHNYFHFADIFHQGEPTALAFGQRDTRQGPGTLKITENVINSAFSLPWFKHFDSEVLDNYIATYKKVIDNINELI